VVRVDEDPIALAAARVILHADDADFVCE
jgi:hypothetical protein